MVAPLRGEIPPLEFIPIAEETELILPLGRWVLKQACRQASAWQRSFPSRQLFASVNVSAREFTQPDFVADVQAALQESGLNPVLLQLEITESVLMEKRSSVSGSLAALRTIGVRIAIDDFGTGYSSLSYLSQYPVDVLKVDKSFIDAFGENAEAGASAAAIIRLAHTLNLQATAEGIERESQLDALRTLQSDSGQGYLFAKPLDALAVAQLLSSADPLNRWRDAALSLGLELPDAAQGPTPGHENGTTRDTFDDHVALALRRCPSSSALKASFKAGNHWRDRNFEPRRYRHRQPIRRRYGGGGRG